MITRAELNANVDPGHGGFSFTYLVERRADGFEARASIRGGGPPPLPTQPPAPSLHERLGKEQGAIVRFLQALDEQHRSLELGDLETAVVMLHPTFFSFRFDDESGRVNRFRYRIECHRHLASPHAGLVRAFEEFFDKAALVERFRLATEARTVGARPWWKFWARS